MPRRSRSTPEEGSDASLGRDVELFDTRAGVQTRGMRLGGYALVSSIVDHEHTILLFGIPTARADFSYVDDLGRLVGILPHDGSPARLFDFAQYRIAPKQTTTGDEVEVGWARVDGGVLYVQHASASPSTKGGQDGYITALDLATGDLLWQSRPLVAARHTRFLLARRHVVAIGGLGYNELTILDRSTRNDSRAAAAPTRTSARCFAPLQRRLANAAAALRD